MKKSTTKFVKNKIRQNMFVVFQRSPMFMKHSISKFIFRPKFGKGVKIFGNVSWGPNVYIGDYSYIYGDSNVANITIGKYCSIARKFSCVIMSHNYKAFTNYSFFMQSNSPLLHYKKINNETDLVEKIKNDTIIGNDVWIGEGVTVFRGVRIGDGVVIGAGALVNKDIPDYAIAVGIPAKVIGYRFDEKKIKYLKEKRWWDWKPEKIYENYEKLCSFE